MSAHYSKFLLNTYAAMPYFQANVPAGYPLDRVLQKCRAFRRLPTNLKELSARAKEWATRTCPERFPAGIRDIEKWYDSDGNELDPDTGRKLTDKEIDAQWDRDASLLDAFAVTDIRVPDGGFPNPATWEPEEKDEETNPESPTVAQLLRDIASRGRQATADEYGISIDQLPRGQADYSTAKNAVLPTCRSRIGVPKHRISEV
jgi:hypothetical protein